jgi:hypothetical protein
MSTFYFFPEPTTKFTLEKLGIQFDNGWIVDDNGNRLDCDFVDVPNEDADICGFTRYGNNDTSFLTDILDEEGIEYYDEYSQEYIDFNNEEFGEDNEEEEEEDDDDDDDN